MKKALIAILIALGVIILIIAGVLTYGNIYASNYTYEAPEVIEIEPNEYNTVTAVGKGLYDENGKRFDIKGINYGNLFISEGWMTVNSVGALYKRNGSFKKVNEQGIVEEYKEIFQEEMDAILAERFTPGEIKALNDAYFYSYCTDADFQLISDIGLNTIRLPVYYRNFMEGPDDALTMRDDAFEKLDHFLDLAKNHGLKVIIDMHGVVGGQSGFEHSGTRRIEFWDNETYIESMCTLWKNIALHYIEDRPDLASTILAYDLVNEPTNRHEIGTGPKQWAVLDRMYQAIREVDSNHVISIEGVWYTCSLPSPEKYGWENVLYQYHFYNWNHDKGISNSMFYGLQFALMSIFDTDFDVPKFVGEFSFFGNEGAWEEYLGKFDSLGWGWTVWSYKIVSVGYWDNSWGIVVNKLNLQNDLNTPIEDYRLKLDLRSATYDEIMAAWSNEHTEYAGQEGSYKIYDNGLLYNVLTKYFDKQKSAE
ncbi:MAG: glycoside hydrolase family 5 protein [Ruminococcaceae bacterium]|nr:glycoside hydrolase family 5 protein [Oscillospiraceae bacterium]